MTQPIAASQIHGALPPTPLDLAVRAVKPAMWTVIAFSFFINILGLTGSIYMMQVYDRVLSSRSIQTLVLLTLIVAILYMVASALEAFRTQLLVRAGVKFDDSIKEHAFDAVQRASLRRPSPSHVQALRDVDTVRDFFAGPGLISCCDVPWVPIYIIFATLLHPVYGILAVLSCVISGVLAYANDRATRAILDRATKANISANNHAVTTFRNAEVLQAMGMVRQLRQRWGQHRGAALGWQGLAADRAAFLVSATKFNRVFMQSVILGVGAYLAIEREITPGMMIAASIVVGRCIQPIETAIGNWKGIVSARSAYRRVQELMRMTPAPAPRMRLPDPAGALSVENLVVHAPGRDVPVLRGVSFAVPPGTTLGVIGPSAAGKSSLARVLVGVWPPSAGAVRLDGSELSHWDPEQLGRSLGYLPQDVELFAGTIADNIARFGERDEAAIVEAAQMAGVHEMIQRLPQGYNTDIGEAGASLSGGQRQRVALARAIYAKPKLIVLDEPNASLDAAGEQALGAAVLALKKAGSTVILVTHKTNSLGLCDMILLLNEGTVHGFGPRDEVLAKVLGPRLVKPEGGGPARVAGRPEGATVEA
ncbi:type I secretion system permease/ATPase [Aquabacter spiritensis]|uniref:ATP-binding cassette subfamily C protein/ATP-binding cassette subfamily C protein RsaD n=1 Tax=Aquabacter spiritensis TaxID=933073 RepID=A0A4V2UY41_9HYPH|nr:type I secretion system permease/ATPase [Aquabacter spiritensis]TCT05928.1 ATP-binding cassette subfamily C protein/ATP-binding cassette subfamily C protein RsaD [Aquabacter spiritensis]